MSGPRSTVAEALAHPHNKFGLLRLVMALAVVNNQSVTLIFDPFTPQAPFFSLTVPLYAVFFVALLVGVLIGGFGAWSAQGRFRRAGSARFCAHRGRRAGRAASGARGGGDDPPGV